MVYTVKNGCVEEPELDYEDGNKTIYLYMKGTKGNPGKELQDMLKYLEKSTEENVKNEDIAAIHRLVTEVKMDEEVGISYMKSWEWEAIIERCTTERIGRRPSRGPGRGQPWDMQKVMQRVMRRDNWKY